MMVHRATQQYVSMNFTMFWKSSQPIQISTRMLISTGAKKVPLLGDQGRGTLPKRGGGDNRTCCRPYDVVSRNKTRCSARGLRTWYTS